MQEASKHWDMVSEVFLEVQEVSGGKQWGIGIWRCRRQAACIWIKAQDGKKISCDDPFQTVPGSIPGSCFHRYPTLTLFLYSAKSSQY